MYNTKTQIKELENIDGIDYKDVKFILTVFEADKKFLSNPYAHGNYKVDLKIRDMLCDAIKRFERQKQYKIHCQALKSIICELKYGKKKIDHSYDLKYYLHRYCKEHLRSRCFFSSFNKLGKAIRNILKTETEKAMTREIMARDSIYASSETQKIFLSAKDELYRLKEIFVLKDCQLKQLQREMIELKNDNRKCNTRMNFLEQENLRLNEALHNSILKTEKIIDKMQDIVEEKVKNEMEIFKARFLSKQEDIDFGNKIL